MKNFSYYKTNSGFVFIDCDYFIDNLTKDLQNFNLCEGTTQKDKKKLTFHYFVTYLFKLCDKKFGHFKPVFFITNKKLDEVNDHFLKSIKEVIELFNKLLPLPFIGIESSEIFVKKNGPLKELEHAMSSFYLKRKCNTIKLRKYLQEEEFYELINVLQDIRNIKSLVN